MLCIFNDEGGASGQIWPNPFGTRPIGPLDFVANHLKWPALRRASRLARDPMGHAEAATVILNRP